MIFKNHYQAVNYYTNRLTYLCCLKGSLNNKQLKEIRELKVLIKHNNQRINEMITESIINKNGG